MADSAATPFQITPFDLFLAPYRLTQAINPWFQNARDDQFGLVNINLGRAGEAETERAVLGRIGSYGRQIGHIAEALDVLIELVTADPAVRAKLTNHQITALTVLQDDVAAVKRMKTK